MPWFKETLNGLVGGLGNVGQRDVGWVVNEIVVGGFTSHKLWRIQIQKKKTS